MPSFRSLASSCSAVLLLVSFPALADEGQDIVLNGADGVPGCAACHGPQGEGNPEMAYPRLAGLNSAYIGAQISNFAGGKRTNEIMQPIAQAMTKAQIDAVAAWLSAQTPPPAPVGAPLDEKLIAAGSLIATDGQWQKGIPACNDCHGPAGLGVGPTFPKLAGQSADYVASQITNWKNGDRSNDPLALMTGIANKLDDADAKAVAAYYASLDPLNPIKTGATQ